MKKPGKPGAIRIETKATEDKWKAARKPLLKPFEFTGWGYQMPKLGVAEERAQLCDEGAAFFEDSARQAVKAHNRQAGARIKRLAKKERALAAWWRNLVDFPEAEAKPHYDSCQSDARKAIDTLLARAEKCDGAFFHLRQIFDQLASGLHALAAHGRKEAANQLLNALCQAVNDFDGLATAKPEIFRSLARGGFGIPAIISPSTEKTDKKKRKRGESPCDNQRLIELLEVGRDYDFAILPTGKQGKKWRFQSKANALAVRLKNHIEHGRIAYELHKLQAQHAGRELPGWLHEAMKLKPFSAKKWPAWAGVAWQVLAEISPNGKPEDHDAFYKTETEICDVRLERKGGYSPSDGPSVAKEDIREALFGAFELIATGTSQRTKRRKKTSPDK